MSKNFATTTVAAAPSPKTSGTALTVAAGTGTRLYVGFAAVHPSGSTPTPANAEIIQITNISTDTLTIVRGRESSTPRSVNVGDVITQGVTAAMWDALYALSQTAVSADAGNTLTRGSDGLPYAAEAGYVRFTTTGATFTPTVELASGSTATVTWTVEGTGRTATGITPTLSFGAALTRHVRMTVADTDGSDALADIVMINLGYDHDDDAGTYVMGAQYDKAAESVAGVENLHLCTGLVRFAAANNTSFVGELSFRGLADLEYVECAYSRVQAVDVTGCTSLIRLCMEQNNLTYLDLNPVAANLRDLRAAAQQGSALTFATLTADLAQLYHFCARDQTVTGMPAGSRLPSVEELWIWNTGQSGTLTVTGPIVSLLAYDNAYTAVTLTGRTTLSNADLSDNSLTQASVDAILAEAVTWNVNNRALDLSGTNAAPSSTGATDRTTLVNRGWTVTVSGATDLWSDDFQRADATGVAAVGNGWTASVATPVADISSGDLVRTDSGGYRVLTNAAGGTLPADYTVTATFSGGSIAGGFFGIVGRWAAANGVCAFFNGNSSSYSELRLCEAAGYLQNSVSLTQDASIPAGWTNSGVDHTFALQFVGTEARIILDGTQVAHGTITINNTTATGVGWAGEGINRRMRTIVVTA